MGQGLMMVMLVSLTIHGSRPDDSHAGKFIHGSRPDDGHAGKFNTNTPTLDFFVLQKEAAQVQYI